MDTNNCSDVLSISIDSVTAFTSSISGISDLDCFGDSDGQATVVPVGGTPPFTFEWDNGETTATANNLLGGDHLVSVTDSNGCTELSFATISEPAPVSATTVVNPATGGGANGSIFANPSGGNPPYQFSWSNGSDQEEITGLAPDFYSCTITDANGCSFLFTELVSQETNTSSIENLNLFRIQPNPTLGAIQINIQLKQAAQIDLELLTISGQVVEKRSLPISAEYRIDFFLTNLPSGVYYCKIQSNKEFSIQKIVKQ